MQNGTNAERVGCVNPSVRMFRLRNYSAASEEMLHRELTLEATKLNTDAIFI